MPSGAPLGLAPLLVLIETVSYVSRAISLGVRLAANLSAGHLLFAILAGFGFNMLVASGLAGVLPLFIMVFHNIIRSSCCSNSGLCFLSIGHYLFGGYNCITLASKELKVFPA